MTDNEIWHGDSRQVTQNLPNGIDLVVTDPPYGMKFQSNMATTPTGKQLAQKIENDDDLEEAIQLFTLAMGNVRPKMKPDSDLYVFTRWDLMQPWKDCIEKLGFTVTMQLIWSKGDPGMGDLDGNWGCGYEVILYAKKGRRPVNYRRSAVLTYDKIPPGQMCHPTEKPVPLLMKLIEMSSDAGDLVVDPFSGSGATSVAARNLNRDSIGIELKLEYVQLARKRLEQGSLLFD